MEPGHAGQRREKAHLAHEQTVQEGPEPLAVPSPYHAPAGLHARRGVGKVRSRIPPEVAAAHTEADALGPVILGGERAADGVSVNMARLADRCGRHHRLCLDVHALFRKPLQVRSIARLAVETDGNVPGMWELGGKVVQPLFGFLRRRDAGQQEVVAPPVAGVVRAPDYEVVASVVDVRPCEPQQGEVSLATERNHVHDPGP